jgi:hypothetical protein
MELSVRLIQGGENLQLRATIIELVGDVLNVDNHQRACSILAQRFGISSVPYFTHLKKQAILIQENEAKILEDKTSEISENDWKVSLNFSNQDTINLNFKNKSHQNIIANLYKRALENNIKRKTNLWTLDSPHIFYEKNPFRTIGEIDAYRRFEVTEVILAEGIGINIHISTAFFTNKSVEHYFQNNRESRFNKLTQRQGEQSGTLLFKSHNGNKKCYFKKYGYGLNCESTDKIFAYGKEYKNLFQYYKQFSDYNILATDSVAYVSFPNLDKVVPVPAKNLLLRVMNDSLPQDLKNLDKISPFNRTNKVNLFWQKLGRKPFGKFFEGIGDSFFTPKSENCGIVELPEIIFKNNKRLLSPIKKDSLSYKQHYRDRKEYLEDYGCFYVYPNIERNIQFPYPEEISEACMEKLMNDVCSKVNKLTHIEVEGNLVPYSNYMSACYEMKKNGDSKVAMFVFEDKDAITYYNIHQELDDWTIKRITKYQLEKKYQHYLDDKEGKGLKNWNSFVDMCTYDLLAKMNIIPFKISANFNFDMQMMIDVSEQHHFFALSLMLCSQKLKVPKFKTISKNNISRKESINPQFLEKYFIELITYFANDIRQSQLKSLLILRDGKECNGEYDAICIAIDKLRLEKILPQDFMITFVEYHKSSIKHIKMFERQDNVLEGTYAILNNKKAMLATTGAGTLNGGTTDLIHLESKNDGIDILRVIQDVFWSSQFNFTSPSIAQRLTLTANKTDEILAEKMAQKIKYIK